MVKTVKCNWPNCDMVGTVLATGRNYENKPGSPLSYYCERHADEAVNEGYPEYIVTCPCCKCNFGVN